MLKWVDTKKGDARSVGIAFSEKNHFAIPTWSVHLL